MSSSAPPQTGRIEPARVVFGFDDAGGIIAAKGAWVDYLDPTHLATHNFIIDKQFDTMPTSIVTNKYTADLVAAINELQRLEAASFEMETLIAKQKKKSRPCINWQRSMTKNRLRSGLCKE